MILSLPHLLDTVKIIKAKLGQMSQQFPKSIFPRTNELGFIDFLYRNIKELLKNDPESIAPVKHHIKKVQLHLKSLKSFFMKVENSGAEQGEMKNLCHRIIDLAYKLEYVVDSVEVDGRLRHSLWLYDLLEDIRLVNQLVSLIPEISYVERAQISQILHPKGLRILCQKSMKW